jgi:hypothetical protein
MSMDLLAVDIEGVSKCVDDGEESVSPTNARKALISIYDGKHLILKVQPPTFA